MGQAEWNKINEISQLRTRRFHRVDDLLWVNSSVSGFKPFIVKGIQKVKASLFYKSNIARLVFRLFIEGEETLYNAATKLSGGWRPCCVVCSKYMGLLTTSRKNCLLFGQHCVDGKSHRSPHKYHILCVPGVYSLESFVFAGVFWKSWELGIFVFLKATIRVQCSQGPDKSLEIFLHYLLTGACKWLVFAQLWWRFCRQSFPFRNGKMPAFPFSDD